MAMMTLASVLLTVRGTTVPPTRDAVRELHNRTAGSEEGVAAARALGDLSHNVFTPLQGVPGTDERELLIIDVWRDAEGIGTFFGDPQVQQGASELFSAREAVVWTPAAGAFGFELDAPRHRPDRYLGTARGLVGEPGHTTEVFAKIMTAGLADGRRRGQLSHQLYMRLPGPAGQAPAEALAVELWCDAEGMAEHYAQLSGFEAAFAAEPVTSVWEAAPGGEWTEW